MADDSSGPADAKTTDEPAAGAPAPQIPDSLLMEEDAPDSLVGEFWLFLKEEKKWWLAPLIAVLLLLGAVIVFAESSAIAPFIYTIF